jgi:2-polyprenyl-3-methyl-5-hydroxy-6-metoxy-1,4-benzoquinol methylase
MAYTLHGIFCAYEVLCCINQPTVYLKDKTALDYGCGTGKNTRAIHYFFANTIGYDPVKECIDVANKEGDYINQPVIGFENKINLCIPGRISFTYNVNDIINTEFDYVFANNVFEHLNYEDQMIAMENMLKMCKKDGLIIFNTFIERSKKMIDYFNIEKKLEITNNFGYYIIKK